MNGGLYQAEKLKYERIHAVPGYSQGPGASYVSTFAKHINPGESVIDFGCGTGDAGFILADLGHPVRLVDIVKDPLRYDLPFLQASLHELPPDLDRADWGFCCDVMEHLPEEWIQAALAGMKARVNKIFFTICGSPDGWGHHIGETLHLTVKPYEWWRERIMKFWPSVTRLDGNGDVFVLVATDPMADERSQEWRERFDRVWQHGKYRQGSTALRMVPFILERVRGGSVVNDYGCGTGRAEVELLKAGIARINMIDISDQALEDGARALIGRGLTFHHASLWNLPKDLPVADWGICINVLMTIPTEKLDAVLAGIRRTCGNLIMEVYDWQDVRLGMELTTIQKDMAWWGEKLRETWPLVSSSRWPDDNRRTVHVCKGGN
jgi:SAM-dependent methyltransferase